jgi:hypothetical protein
VLPTGLPAERGFDDDIVFATGGVVSEGWRPDPQRDGGDAEQADGDQPGGDARPR